MWFVILLKIFATWAVLGFCALQAMCPIGDKDTPVYHKLV